MIYLALGSNLSGDYADSQQLIAAAIDHLPLCGAHVVARAPLYRSAAVGPKINGQGQGNYINTVVAVRGVVPAVALLQRLHALEAAFGRERRVPWGPRTLDIDIVSYHDEIHAHGAQIPHPRLAARAFVLYPLRDIAPGWRHPLSGRAIDTLIQALPTSERLDIQKI
jgi:2-amino-4-hydroxy-6-hydroxymethyldihydropteridine diphosphokinase